MNDINYFLVRNFELKTITRLQLQKIGNLNQ